MLPKTASEIRNGGLYRQAVRCGKPGCRCASGKLHEGYYYFIFRIKGRLRKTYVPKRDIETVRTLIKQSRRLRRSERQTRYESSALLAGFAITLRKSEIL